MASGNDVNAEQIKSVSENFYKSIVFNGINT